MARDGDKLMKMVYLPGAMVLAKQTQFMTSIVSHTAGMCDT